jgi:F-type H+-transporting ATPase subunit a
LALLTLGLFISLGLSIRSSIISITLLSLCRHSFYIHVHRLRCQAMTLAFRLFGNIFAGEVLIKVILMLPGI